jgi:hypothetical protein
LRGGSVRGQYPAPRRRHPDLRYSLNSKSPSFHVLSNQGSNGPYLRYVTLKLVDKLPK